MLRGPVCGIPARDKARLLKQRCLHPLTFSCRSLVPQPRKERPGPLDRERNRIENGKNEAGPVGQRQVCGPAEKLEEQMKQGIAASKTELHEAVLVQQPGVREPGPGDPAFQEQREGMSKGLRCRFPRDQVDARH